MAGLVKSLSVSSRFSKSLQVSPSIIPVDLHVLEEVGAEPGQDKHGHHAQEASYGMAHQQADQPRAVPQSKRERNNNPVIQWESFPLGELGKQLTRTCRTAPRWLSRKARADRYNPGRAAARLGSC